MPTGKYWHNGTFEDITYDTRKNLTNNSYYFNCKDVSSVFVKYDSGAFNIYTSYYTEDGTASSVMWSGGAGGATFTIDKTQSVCYAYNTATGLYITFTQ